MNKKQITLLIVAILFILLNLSVAVSAMLWAPKVTFTLMGLDFVFGVIAYFILRFHRQEIDYRKREASRSKVED